jgi:hypothetical protein
VNPAPAVRHGRRAAGLGCPLGSSTAAGSSVRHNQGLKARPHALNRFALARKRFIAALRLAFPTYRLFPPPALGEGRIAQPQKANLRNWLLWLKKVGEGACSSEGVMLLIAYYVIFVIAGSLSDYFIGLIVEREFGSHVSLLVFLALYFVVLWLAWLLAVRATKPKRAVPAARG